MARTWANVEDMALHYRVSESTVRNKVNSGEWPAERIGNGKRRMIRFSPEQQDQIDANIRTGQRAHSNLDWLDEALDKIIA